MIDQQMKNGAFNGSFLVLNLGTNTLELGNSFTIPMPSESFHPIPLDKTPCPNAAVNADTVSSSTEEGSSSSESHRTKRVSEEKEDPDWVPQKKSRKISNSGCSTAKLKQGPSIGSQPSQISPLGGVNGNVISRSGPPPQYLMSLLSFFGWRVVFRPGHGDYVYISPAGLAYCSLPKAFETFLHGTSKYNEKASVSSRFLGNNALRGSPLERAAPSDSNLGLGSGSAGDDNGKKRRGRKKRNSTVAENIKPMKPCEEPLRPKDDPLVDSGKKNWQMPDTMECPEARRVSSLCKVDEKTKSHVEDRCWGNKFNQLACGISLSNSDMFRDGKLFGVRRSMRISGKHIPVETEKNIEGTNGNCLYLSAGEVSGDKVKDKEQIPAISRTKTVLDERPEACKIDEGLNNEVIKSDCSNMGVIKNDQSSRSRTDKDNKSVGLRRSRRLRKKNDVVDVELDAQKGAENSYLAKTKSVVSTDARKDKKNQLISESASVAKMHCSLNGESLHGQTKRSDCNSTIRLSETNVSDMHGCGNIIGIRRSMRINGKHVPVDDESDTEMWADDDLLDLSEFGGNRVAKKDKEKPRTSFFEINNMEGGSSASTDMQLKQTDINESDCQKRKIHKQLERYSFKKTEKAQKSRCEESSASLKDFAVEIPISEKCSPSSAAQRKPTGGWNLNGKKKEKRRGGCGLLVRRNGKDDHQEEILSQAKISILSWLIDCGTLTENDKVVYITKNSMAKTSTGLVTRGGIWCYCCKEVVPLFKFVAHAGGNLQQPWENIFLLSGKTLLLCLKEAWEKEKKRRKVGFQTVGVDDPDPSDDTCGVCADGGHLICCDSCPSTFHQNCVMLQAFPEGSWYCPYCRCTFCMAAVHGSDVPFETSTLLSCKQCGRKYHQECAWGNYMQGMGSVPFSFCGKNCEKVATQLSDMLGITNPIEEGFSWTLLKRLDEDEGVSSNQRLSLIMESNVKLSMSLSVLDECFVPLIDQRTGVDMICQAVYNCGSNFNRLNYKGFYTLILEKDEEIISVASLRLHGTSLAEMPFIGTRPMYRRQGMCRRLLMAVEDMLSSLHVEKLIIPAIPDLLKTWMTSFSFKPLESSHKDEIKNLSMMIFAETTLLQKSIHSIGALVQEVMPADNGVNHGKSIQESHELPRSLGDQINTGDRFAGAPDWWIHECVLKEQKDAAPEPCRMIKNSSFAPDSLAILPPNIFTGSISEASPVQRTFMTNFSTAPHSLTASPLSFSSINVVLDNDPLGAGTIATPNSDMNRWFQGADEVKDLQIDAITSSLSFDSLLRIRS